MDAITKFKEAVKGLQSDERYLALMAAHKANDEDETLQDMLKEFNLLRLDVNNELDKQDRDEQRIVDLNTRINELYNSIMGNERMLAYNDAKQGMEQLIEYVNAILGTAFEGGDPMLVEEPVAGCSEEACASCAGCGN